MTDTLAQTIDDWLDRHPENEASFRTPLEALRILRSAKPVTPGPVVYKPQICLNLRGDQQLFVGDQVYKYNEGQFLLVSVDLPVQGRVTRLGDAGTFLGVILDIDVAAMMRVAEKIDANGREDKKCAVGVFVADLGVEMRNAFERLVALLDRPAALSVLAPAVLDELYYWLLTGPHGAQARRLFRAESHAQKIARSIAQIRSNPVEPVIVEDLASLSGMSLSSFHQHFKSVTSLSPLQYQKRLRLLMAREMMLSEGLNASDAAFRVGYASPSQFSREYSRTFGASPRRDVASFSQA